MTGMSSYTYTCSAGESFDGVALLLYGDERYAPDILNANPEHAGKLVFEGGEKLYLPVIEVYGDEGGRGDSAPVNAPWRE